MPALCPSLAVKRDEFLQPEGLYEENDPQHHGVGLAVGGETHCGEDWRRSLRSVGFRRSTAQSWDWGLTLVRPLANCVALGKSYTLSG